MDEKIELKFIKGENAAKYSALINLVLAIVKGVIGLLSGSIALIADSIDSFSDIFASLAVYIGFRLSQRKPDEKFPYGYYKVQTFASLIISAIIIVTGTKIALESLYAFLNPVVIKIPLVSLSAAAGSAIILLALARYKNKIGTEIGSRALIDDAKHSIIDVLSSTIVFIGILSSYLGYLKIQGISGILVSFLIVYIGITIAKNAVLVLLDACLEPEKVKMIKSIAENIDGVEGIHDVKVRRSGPFIFAELQLATKKKLSVKKAYEISNNVEKAVKNEIRDLDRLTVQIEPVKTINISLAVPLKNDDGLESEVSDHFGKAPYYIIAEVHKGNIKNYNIKKNPAASLEKKRGIETAKFLVNENIDVLVTSEVGEGPKYVLSDYLVDIVAPEGAKLNEILINTSKRLNRGEFDEYNDIV